MIRKHFHLEVLFLCLYTIDMKILPQNDMVLCTLAESSKKDVSFAGFKYTEEQLPLYKVEQIGPAVKMDLKVGDIVVVNSTGTLAVIDNAEHYLFKEENIAGKAV